MVFARTLRPDAFPRETHGPESFSLRHRNYLTGASPLGISFTDVAANRRSDRSRLGRPGGGAPSWGSGLSGIRPPPSKGTTPEGMGFDGLLRRGFVTPLT